MLEGGIEASLYARYQAVRRRLAGPPPKPRMALPQPAASEPEPVDPEPDVLIPPGWPKWGWRGIVGEVCEKHGIRVAELMDSNQRRQPVVACRHEVIYRMRTEIVSGGRPLSYKTISVRLNLDPASVRFALKSGGWIARTSVNGPKSLPPANHNGHDGKCGDRAIDLAISPAAANEVPLERTSPVNTSDWSAA